MRNFEDKFEDMSNQKILKNYEIMSFLNIEVFIIDVLYGFMLISS